MPFSCQPTDNEDVDLYRLAKEDVEEEIGGNLKRTSPLND